MIVLRLLANSPKNGVELMDAIQEMTHGWWRPSPGSIYPVLEQLEKDKLVEKGKNGKYELTETAEDEMEWSFGPSYRKPRSVEGTIAEMTGFVSYVEELVKSDPKRIDPYLGKIREVADRLASLAKRKSD